MMYARNRSRWLLAAIISIAFAANAFANTSTSASAAGTPSAAVANQATPPAEDYGASPGMLIMLSANLFDANSIATAAAPDQGGGAAQAAKHATALTQASAYAAGGAGFGSRTPSERRIL